MLKFNPLQRLPYITIVYVHTRALKLVLCMLLCTYISLREVDYWSS